MRYALIMAFIVAAFHSVGAQEEAGQAYGLRQVSLSTTYQNWSLNSVQDVSEFSTPLRILLPVGDAFSFALYANYASVSADSLASLSGFTDMQLGISYLLESANLLFSLGVNVPVGRRALSDEQFITSSLISYSVFRFEVPFFGEGFGLSPGLTWAIPLSESVVAGLGVTYQYKDRFRPLAGLDMLYEPGAEIMLTTGMDIRIAETASLTADVIVTGYGTDRLEGREVFAAGKKLVANLQFRQYFAFNELWVFARYRTRAKNQLAKLGQLMPESAKSTPDEFELLAHYRWRLHRTLWLKIMLETRFQQKTTSAFSGASLFGLGLSPTYRLTPQITLPLQILFFSGKLRGDVDLGGLEISTGLGFQF